MTEQVLTKQRVDLADTKVIPHSLEAEQSVIGGLMIDNQAWDKVSDQLSDLDFYRHNHQLIYRIMADLAAKQQPFDVLTLSDALKERKILDEAGGELYLFELAKNTPSAANIVAYADIVRRRSVLRQLITTTNEIADAAFNPEGRDTVELLDEAERKIFKIAEQGARGTGPRDVKEFIASASERIDLLYESDEAITGLATGFSDLDEMTSGLQEGDLVIIAGRPSMGKTMLGVNIAEYAAMNKKKPVLIFSLEMPGESIVMRMLSSLGRIEQNKVRTGKLSDDDWPRLTSSISMLSEAPLFIDDTPALSPAEVRSRARRIAKEHGDLGLILVDYLQLMQIAGKNENRTAEISEISRSLKALAKELNVPVIALSQLNRSLEQRTDKRPVMSDLRECVTGGTLVCLSNGERVPIQSLVGQQPDVLSMDEMGKITSARCETVWPVGKKSVHDIRLASGHSIKASSEHRLYAANGWKVVSELEEGDRLGVAKPLSELKKEDESDVFWDRVVSISPAGEEEVYDLTVPGLANWLADGVISHNSGAIEQDADVIGFIYRDEVYNPESPDKGVAEVIIAKQRNGPIGKVRLTFLGQFTKFENFTSQQTYGYE